MPKIINGQKVDEAKWEKAKKLVAEQYDLTEGDKFYSLVMAIYKKMMGMKSLMLIMDLRK